MISAVKHSTGAYTVRLPPIKFAFIVLKTVCVSENSEYVQCSRHGFALYCAPTLTTAMLKKYQHTE